MPDPVISSHHSSPTSSEFGEQPLQPSDIVYHNQDQSARSSPTPSEELLQDESPPHGSWRQQSSSPVHSSPTESELGVPLEMRQAGALGAVSGGCTGRDVVFDTVKWVQESQNAAGSSGENMYEDEITPRSFPTTMPKTNQPQSPHAHSRKSTSSRDSRTVSAPPLPLESTSRDTRIVPPAEKNSKDTTSTGTSYGDKEKNKENSPKITAHAQPNYQPLSSITTTSTRPITAPSYSRSLPSPITIPLNQPLPRPRPPPPAPKPTPAVPDLYSLPDLSPTFPQSQLQSYTKNPTKSSTSANQKQPKPPPENPLCRNPAEARAALASKEARLLGKLNDLIAGKVSAEKRANAVERKVVEAEKKMEAAERRVEGMEKSVGVLGKMVEDLGGRLAVAEEGRREAEGMVDQWILEVLGEKAVERRARG